MIKEVAVNILLLDEAVTVAAKLLQAKLPFRYECGISGWKFVVRESDATAVRHMMSGMSGQSDSAESKRRVYQVELSSTAYVRQRQFIVARSPKEAVRIAKDHAGDSVWQYDGICDTVEGSAAPVVPEESSIKGGQ